MVHHLGGLPNHFVPCVTGSCGAAGPGTSQRHLPGARHLRERARDLEVETRGSFGGLGIEITIKNGALTVVAPIEDTPAFRGGLKAGDQIIKIDDDFTKDMSLTEAVKRMRGPKGSKIKLTLHRNGVSELFTVTLARDVIKIQSVKAKMLDGGYGYIRVTTFQEN